MSRRPGSAGADYVRGMGQASRGLSLALGFVGVVMACFFAGRGIDHLLGTEPWIQVTGSMIGFVLGFMTVYYGSRPNPRHEAPVRGGTSSR